MLQNPDDYTIKSPLKPTTHHSNKQDIIRIIIIIAIQIIKIFQRAINSPQPPPSIHSQRTNTTSAPNLYLQTQHHFSKMATSTIGKSFQPWRWRSLARIYQETFRASAIDPPVLFIYFVILGTAKCRIQKICRVYGFRSPCSPFLSLADFVAGVLLPVVGCRSSLSAQARAIGSRSDVLSGMFVQYRWQ